MSDWTQDDELWAHFAEALFTEERMDAASDELDELLALDDMPTAGSALDLACGPGRHAVELARRGFRVTGLDRTDGYLARARERAAAAGVDVEWMRADMRELDRPGEFDLVINLFSSFGYFSDEENARVAQAAMSSLRPGGAFVLEMAGKEILAEGFWPRRWHPVGDGYLLEHTHIIDDWARLENEWTLITGDGARYQHRFHHRIYSGAELKRVLWDAGADDVTIYGGLDGSPYDEDAERLVAVARRA